MATSGRINTTNYEGRYLSFEWAAQAPDLANNRVRINWTLKGAGTGEVKWYNARNFQVSAGSFSSGVSMYNTATPGTVETSGLAIYTKMHSSTSEAVQLYDGTVVATGSFVVNYSANGEAAFTISVKCAIYTFAQNCSGSARVTLDTVARASQPSCVTWPEHTQNVGEFGDTISIHMNRKADTFTHTVRYAYGKLTGTIATGVTTGTTWTIPLSFMDLIPNATSGSGTIYVDTYSGSTLIGTKYCGFTAKVPASVKPTCTMTLEDVTGVGDIYGSPVQRLSKIKVKVTAKTAYSSPISAYQITAAGIKYSAAEATTELLPTAGNVPVTAMVTDKRGRSGSTSYTMNVQAYDYPAITALAVRRCDANGTVNDQGKYVQVTFSATVYGLNSKNTAAYVLRYKKSSDTTFTEVALSALKNAYTVNSFTSIFAADESSSYDVEVTATDRHGSATRSTSASTAFSLMDWHPSGTGLRFGGVAEDGNTMRCSLDAIFDEEVVSRGNQYSFSSPGVAGSGGFVLMAAIEVIASHADAPITFVFSQRLADHPMTVHLRLQSTAALTPSLHSISYEGSNYDAYASQISPSVWGLYVKKVSEYDTITLQSWSTSQTTGQRIEVTFPGTLVDQVPTPYYKATPAKYRNLLDYIYPVGSIYLSYSHNSPADLFGGTWVRIQNAFLWAVDASGEIGLTGGEKNVTLTVDQIPAHSHGSVYSQHATGTKDKAWYNTTGSSVAYGPVSTGGGSAHNNMPPYIQVSAWRRTA